LGEIYNLGGLTPLTTSIATIVSWERSIILGDSHLTESAPLIVGSWERLII